MEEKFEQGVKRGMDIGCEEGYTVAKGGFDGLLEKIKAREAQKKANTTESGTQMNPKTTTTSIHIQTNTLAPDASTPLHITTSTQTESPAANMDSVDTTSPKLFVLGKNATELQFLTTNQRSI
jgi:hypothetical protein